MMEREDRKKDYIEENRRHCGAGGHAVHPPGVARDKEEERPDEDERARDRKHELRPRAVSLGYLSASRLIEAIRDAVLSHSG